MNVEKLWQEFLDSLPDATGLAIGPLFLWLKEREGDLLVHVDRNPERDPDNLGILRETPPDTKGWKRLGSWEELKTLRLIPVFPDRAVVVRPEFSYTVVPSEKVQFFVSVPASVSLVRSEGDPLFTEPVILLSNTWFGLPTDGELGYAMRTRARRNQENLDVDPWRIVCPVRIRNQSKEPVSFERLCLRVNYLSIYRDKSDGLWGNESSVIFRERDDANRVAYAQGAPAFVRDPTLVTEGREDPNGTFLYRAFAQGKGFFQ